MHAIIQNLFSIIGVFHTMKLAFQMVVKRYDENPESLTKRRQTRMETEGKIRLKRTLLFVEIVASL